MPEHTAPHLAAASADRVLSIARLFDAPRAAVYDAFVDAEQVLRWLGPRGYAMTHYEADVRPGGLWRGCMRALDDGRELWHGGVYRDVVPDERLQFTFAFELDGARGCETLVTITFEDCGNQTLMSFRQSGFATSADAESYRAGWESEFDRLARLPLHVRAPLFLGGAMVSKSI